MEKPSLEQRIAAMKGEVAEKQAEVAQTEQQTTQQLVTEIADSIQGHYKMDVRHQDAVRESAADWTKRPGGGYREDQYNLTRAIDAQKVDLKAGEQKLELSRAQIAELEHQLGPEAVAELKQQLEQELGELEKARGDLLEKEKSLDPNLQKGGYFKHEQDEAAKNIPEFATKAVLQAHKEFGGKDYSERAGELKKLALQEVGIRGLLPSAT